MSVKKWFLCFCLFALSFHGSFLFSENIQKRHTHENSAVQDVNDKENILAVEAFLQKTVPGLSVSYAEVLETIVSEGHEITLIGGALRDLLLDEPLYPNDVDFIYSCTADELEAILIRHGWGYTRLPDSHLIQIGNLDGHFLQGVPTIYSDPEDVNQQDFTVNQLAYDLKTHRFLERSQEGFRDLKDKKLRILSKEWKKWLIGNPARNRRDKIFRFWRMVSKGYTYSVEFERFIQEETLALQKEEPEFLIVQFIKYFSSHLESYDEALAGCKVIMGREWSEKNLMSLYEEFRFQDSLRRERFLQHTYFFSQPKSNC